MYNVIVKCIYHPFNMQLCLDKSFSTVAPLRPAISLSIRSETFLQTEVVQRTIYIK